MTEMNSTDITFSKEILIVDGKLSIRNDGNIYPVNKPDDKGVFWAEKWEGYLHNGEFYPTQFIKSLT